MIRERYEIRINHIVLSSVVTKGIQSTSLWWVYNESLSNESEITEKLQSNIFGYYGAKQ